MLASRRHGSAGRRALWLLAAPFLGGPLAAACSDSSAPTSVVKAPDDVINDTRDASVRATQNPDDGAAPDGYVNGQPIGEGGYGDDAPTASYPGVAECASCSCPSTKAYCFGGATPGKGPMSLRPQIVDAGSACPMVAAGALGCTPLPAGITTCGPLIEKLQPSYACYLVCAFNGTTMTAYCPSP